MCDTIDRGPLLLRTLHRSILAKSKLDRLPLKFFDEALLEKRIVEAKGVGQGFCSLARASRRPADQSAAYFCAWHPPSFFPIEVVVGCQAQALVALSNADRKGIASASRGEPQEPVATRLPLLLCRRDVNPVELHIFNAR